MPRDPDAPHFHNEDSARQFLEEVRWSDGPVCPYCGVIGSAYKTQKAGVYRCGERECRKDFTVRVGTLFERSHIPLHTWLLTAHLLTSSRKDMSSHQMHRMLGVTYKTAWFMTHRIREAMKDNNSAGPLGGEGSLVEADETFVGGKAQNRAYRKPAPKKAVVALVERQDRVRSRHVADVNADNPCPILETGVDKASHLRTDESGVYWKVGEQFASHRTVNHSADEHVRGDASTNAAENFFSIRKRRIYGTYQHVSAAHPHRYLAEFGFRHSNRSGLGISDAERAVLALKGIEGKRLTYGGIKATNRVKRRSRKKSR